MTRKSSDAVSKVQSGARKSWSWLRFICGFVVFAPLMFFDFQLPFFHDFWAHVVEVTIIATICGALMARSGDVAFEWILSALR